MSNPTQQTLMQRCAVGAALVALIAASAALQFGVQTNSRKPPTVRVSNQGAAWVSTTQFLTSQSRQQTSISSEQLSFLLMQHRALFDVTWPTYGDMPEALTPREPKKLREAPEDDYRFAGYRTEFVAASPLVASDHPVWSYNRSGFGESSIPDRWTGPIGMLRELITGIQIESGDVHLPEVLACLHMHGFTSCRVDDRTYYAGRVETVVSITVGPMGRVTKCRFVPVFEAVAELVEGDYELVSRHGSRARVSELDPSVLIQRVWRWGEWRVEEHCFCLSAAPFVSTVQPCFSPDYCSEQWVAHLANAIGEDVPFGPVERTNEEEIAFATVFAPCVKPSWLKDSHVARRPASHRGKPGGVSTEDQNKLDPKS